MSPPGESLTLRKVELPLVLQPASFLLNPLRFVALPIFQQLMALQYAIVILGVSRGLH